MSKQMTQGAKWSKAGTHSNFEDADAERKVLLNGDSVQAKVRRRSSTGMFTVVFRKDPALLEAKKDKKSKKEKRSKKKRAPKEA